MKLTGQLEIDTPLLAAAVAQLLTDDEEKIRALSARAKRHYAQGGLFARRMRGSRSREWLRVFMLHWLDSMKDDYLRYRKVHADDFTIPQNQFQSCPTGTFLLLAFSSEG